MDLSINNGGIRTNLEGLANIDRRYGPYASVNAAHAALAADELNAVGLTVGIKTGDTITEYWYNGGTALANLVPKQTAASGGGEGGSSVPVTEHVTHSGSAPATFEVNGGEYHTFSDEIDSLVFTLGTVNPYTEAYLEFTTSENFTVVTWPTGCRFLCQEPMLTSETTYLMSVVNGIIAVTEVVNNA